MSRYIDADALLNDNGNSFCFNGNDRYYHESVISNAPTADVAPVVHGRWIPKEESVWNLESQVVVDWLCSGCGKSGHYTLNYCPNCGAIMDGKDGETDD